MTDGLNPSILHLEYYRSGFIRLVRIDYRQTQSLRFMAQFSFVSKQVWGISELTSYMRDLLESDPTLQDIWVEGEVSNLSRPVSGHIYFTLKDSSSALRCVIWRNSAMRLDSSILDGQAIEAHGAISIYNAGGQYQLYVDNIRPVGEGRLFQEFLQLKQRLEAEGLFDRQRKRPIPQWPNRIGIVTSPTGAAIQDILDTIRRRYPVAEVILSPTVVQGAEAPTSIISSLKALNRLAQPDVILVARGGGSIEDLWAFNDEGVARAILDSQAPVISGIGHETDFTICDFVSDLRAPTPTAAAEMATPDQVEIQSALFDYAQRLEWIFSSNLSGKRRELDNLRNILELRSPRSKIRTDRQYLDDLSHRGYMAVENTLRLAKADITGFSRNLISLDPIAVMKRGYASIFHLDGPQVRSISQVATDDLLNVHLADGKFLSRVESIPSREEE